MSYFTGTNPEFKRYIGPRLRNLVQKITQKHKATIAACEHCGVADDLEAAHIRGRDRNQIIDLLMAANSSAHVVIVDLEKFETDFRREHDPLEKAILILCRRCHSKYDSGHQPALSNGTMATSAKPLAALESTPGILPIVLDPSPSAEFKRRLLTSRKAKIVIHYGDGRIDHRPWDASRFSENSNVMGNLRSRPEFRSGAWQAAGILKVHACVTNTDT